jgi:NDP-sugar pyrophosphorylase family protein
MNEIQKKPLSSIGYQFIEKEFLPEGKDEYYLRNQQLKNGIHYRNLTAYEIEVLVRNNNTSDNWNNIRVSNEFNPELVKHCKFYGLVRVGKLETISLEYHNVTLPVGLYNSTIISCDFGDNVVVNHVNYMSHYIIGNEVIILNVDELHTTNHSKFGNGLLKEGESESVRVWVEVCNENAGRKILPFDGMLPGDAYLWSRYRDDEVLMEKFKGFTEKKFDNKRGYYGMIGDRTVIKNTGIIKDVWIGSDAYIKGANKLKNLTINSSPEAASQIGEGCELVNGIISYGCRLFYGVKAVRFIMGTNSQLKYGARLINSFLGDNSTISCCEVLNSLIFPGHEQHHNNSFLCAALVMGQSNIAAGATLGSNHNSRAADGELIAARGFWPGLCVSIKHNSKFASFTLLAKGDYSYELNIPLPFSLVSNDVSNNQLSVRPAYWFMYNLYALARNAGKYVDRDKRTKKLQHIEYDFLAPDSINEIFSALDVLKKLTAQAQSKNEPDDGTTAVLLQERERILEDPSNTTGSITISNSGFENSSRPVCISKVNEAYRIYKDLVIYYGITNLIDFISSHSVNSFHELIKALPKHPVRLQWVNIGGQLLPANSLNTVLQDIKSNTIQSWDELHKIYEGSGKIYGEQKLQHACASLLELLKIEKLEASLFKDLLLKAQNIKEWMVKTIYDSRAKDYQSGFRKMVYGSEEEMEVVTGRLEDNVFINQQREELKEFKCSVEKIISLFRL